MNLQAGYGDVRVLWDVSLEVAAGELVCIIGSNGAGKTTLMRCLSGLLQPSAGSIVIDGRPMAQASPAPSEDRWRRRRRQTSSAPASPMSRRAAACSRL